MSILDHWSDIQKSRYNVDSDKKRNVRQACDKRTTPKDFKIDQKKTK